MLTVKSKTKILPALIATVALSLSLSQVVHAQSTTLRDPLIPGAQGSAPFIPATGNPAESVGAGSVPLGVTPGMPLPSTLLPWVPAVPANQINEQNSGINFTGSGYGPPIETPPGVLGPALSGLGVIPNEPSTPGNNPGPLNSPPGYIIPSQLLNVNAGGGHLPGTGGYYGSIPNTRRSGQTTTQWEERGLYSTFGGGGNSQDETTETGPLAGFGVPYGVPTGNGYNNGPAGSNNDLRNSSVDLGGGQRLKIGGTKISSGSSLQDYGLSALRNNPIGALTAHQSTEFGQGFWREPTNSSNTTDFGFSYRQFNPANEDSQKTGQLLLPTAIETNK